MRSDVFFDSVQAKDVAARRAARADDVRFLSPVVFRPYEGRELVAGVLGVAAQGLEDFEYVRRFEDDDGGA